mmetsp:Transcript_20728/g.43644  ORF Transcript_20728/g.43644 Transcript_20728/m.43644 type:complete len:214 (+) Transcript_20728:2-643(+)
MNCPKKLVSIKECYMQHCCCGSLHLLLGSLGYKYIYLHGLMTMQHAIPCIMMMVVVVRVVQGLSMDTSRSMLIMLHGISHRRNHAPLSLFCIHIGIHAKLFGNKFLEGSRIPSVLDVILTPRAVEDLDADLDPSFAELLVSPPQAQIILSREGQVVDRRVEIIDPSITDLFSRATGKLGCEVGPLSERRVGLRACLTIARAIRASATTGEDDP